jgi:hypothetical protein
MIYGLRVYRVVQGRMAALLIRSGYCALGWRDDFLGTVGWRRKSAKARATSARGVAPAGLPNLQRIQGNRNTGVV